MVNYLQICVQDFVHQHHLMTFVIGGLVVFGVPGGGIRMSLHVTCLKVDGFGLFVTWSWCAGEDYCQGNPDKSSTASCFLSVR